MSAGTDSVPALSPQSSLSSDGEPVLHVCGAEELLTALRILLLGRVRPSSPESFDGDSTAATPVESPVADSPVTHRTAFDSVALTSAGNTTSDFPSDASDTTSAVSAGRVDPLVAKPVLQPFVPSRCTTFVSEPVLASCPQGPVSVCQLSPVDGELYVYNFVDSRWWRTTYYVGALVPVGLYPFHAAVLEQPPW